MCNSEGLYGTRNVTWFTPAYPRRLCALYAASRDHGDIPPGGTETVFQCRSVFNMRCDDSLVVFYVLS